MEAKLTTIFLEMILNLKFHIAISLNLSILSEKFDLGKRIMMPTLKLESIPPEVKN